MPAVDLTFFIYYKSVDYSCSPEGYYALISRYETVRRKGYYNYYVRFSAGVSGVQGESLLIFQEPLFSRYSILSCSLPGLPCQNSAR